MLCLSKKTDSNIPTFFVRKWGKSTTKKNLIILIVFVLCLVCITSVISLKISSETGSLILTFRVRFWFTFGRKCPGPIVPLTVRYSPSSEEAVQWPLALHMMAVQCGFRIITIHIMTHVHMSWDRMGIGMTRPSDNSTTQCVPTTRLTDNSTHGQVDSRTSRLIDNSTYCNNTRACFFFLNLFIYLLFFKSLNLRQFESNI